MNPLRWRCGLGALDGVVLTDGVERFLQVVDEAGGNERLAATWAGMRRGIFASAPVEFDADGGGTFDDVKELAKWQGDQPERHHSLVRERDEPVIGAVEEGA